MVPWSHLSVAVAVKTSRAVAIVLNPGRPIVSCVERLDTTTFAVALLEGL